MQQKIKTSHCHSMPHVPLHYRSIRQVAKDADCSDMVTKAMEVKGGCEQVIAEAQEASEAAKAARKN